MPLVAKSAIWFTACNILLKGLSFITVPIFTQLIPTEEYGKLTLFLSYEQIILIFATWEIHIGAYQRGLFRYKETPKEFTSNTMVLINILTIICGILVVCFRDKFKSFTGMDDCTIFLLFIYFLFIPSYFAWLIKKRTSYEYKKATGVTIAFSILNIIIPLLAVIFINATAYVKFNSTLIISALFGVVIYFSTVSYTSISKDKSTLFSQWKYLLIYQAPLVLHSLSYYVLNQADRVMIGKMIGNEEAAFYGVAYTLAMAITILQYSLDQALIPWRYHKLEENNFIIINKSTNSILIIFGSIVLFFILIAPDIFYLLLPENYHSAVWCIPPIVAGTFFMLLYSIFVSVETYYEKTKYVMFISIVCGIFNIAANYICIPLFGYISCAYTTLLSYILFAILHYFCAKFIFKRILSQFTIFSGYKILAISSIIVVLSLLFTLLYNFALARYFMCFTIILLGFIFRKRVLIFLNILKTRKYSN